MEELITISTFSFFKTTVNNYTCNFLKVNMKKLSLVFVIVIAILSSCRSGRTYTSQNPDLYKVKTIAILPVKVIFSGNQPKKLTKGQLDSIADNDGYIYQMSLKNNLLSRSGGKNRIGGVSYQAVEKTNSVLMKAGYNIDKIVTTDPDELAKILDVDAVIRMEVTSNRIMSDLANLGLDILNDILIRNNKDIGVLNGANNRTADVTANATLIYNGKTLWNARYNRPTDWQQNLREIVDAITAAMGRNFPY